MLIQDTYFIKFGSQVAMTGKRKITATPTIVAGTKGIAPLKMTPTGDRMRAYIVLEKFLDI
jgi:hypothetical protein